MSRLAALVPASVCAGALGRAWSDDIDGRIRCIDEGTRALGLAYCCAPWSTAAEDEALRAELGDGAMPHDTLERLDAVTAGLARTPSAPPVIGLVSGPLTWAARVGAANDPEAIDAASDLAAARLRALSACEIEAVAVVEAVGNPPTPDVGTETGLAAEAHGPLVRAAEHLRVDVGLIAIGAAAGRMEKLGYQYLVSSSGSTDGLEFMPASAFGSPEAAAGCVEDRRSELSAAGVVVSAPLSADVDPACIRHVAALLGGLEQGGQR